MSYDLTGLSALWHQRNHPWVRAQAEDMGDMGDMGDMATAWTASGCSQAYLYLLDTVTVGVGFPEKFEALSTVLA